MTHPQEQQPLVSVVIVSYNVRDLLANCLHSLKSALAQFTHEIFVVDNRSDDDSVEMVRATFPDVHCIANRDNRGFARANNQALAQARGRYLLLLNPDTLVQEDTIAVMRDFFETHPDAGLAGCKIITPDGALEPACRRSFPSPWVSFTKLTGLATLFPHSRVFARYNLTYLDVGKTCEVDAVSGSFMMVRREVYEAVGGLDEMYFMYGEDLDWCYKIQKAGFRVYYVHSTQIIHFGGQSTKRSNIDANAIFYDAMRLFARKNLALSPVSSAVISLGINLRLMIARVRRNAHILLPVLLDAFCTALTVMLAEVVRFGRLFTLPDYAYPVIYLAPLCIVLFSLLVGGVYGGKPHSLVRSLAAVFMSFLFLSSVTYFFKPYAFSRAIVITSSLMNLAAIPGWRIVAAFLVPGRRSQFAAGRTTLLVGLNEHTANVLRRLRRYDDGSHNIVGIVDTDNRRVGEVHEGLPIIGSTEYLAKLIEEYRVADIIFVPEVLKYADMLSIISRAAPRPVRFKLVPRESDAAAGIDLGGISGIPLMNMEYNITRRSNLFLKRALDLLLATPGFLAFGALRAVLPAGRRGSDSLVARTARLRDVIAGRLSLVGYPIGFAPPASGMYLGRAGLTGVAQLRRVPANDVAEITRLSIRYARNYSIFLDIEILFRSLRKTKPMTMDDRRSDGENNS